MIQSEFAIIGLSASLKITLEIANYLNITPINIDTKRFRSEEYLVTLYEAIAPDKKLFIVGSLLTNDNIIEMLSIIDAAKNAGAKDINLIIPYMGYSRQDLMQSPYSSIGIKIIAKILEPMQINHLITVDIHSILSLNFFPMKVTNIGVSEIINHYSTLLKLDDYNIIALDKGAKDRLSNFGSKLIYMNKKRHYNNIDMELYGNVEGKKCFIIDDILDSGNSMHAAIKCLKRNKASQIKAYVTHYLGHSRLPLPLYVTDTATLIAKENFFEKILPISPVICKFL